MKAHLLILCNLYLTVTVASSGKNGWLYFDVSIKGLIWVFTRKIFWTKILFYIDPGLICSNGLILGLFVTSVMYFTDMCISIAIK